MSATQFFDGHPERPSMPETLALPGGWEQTFERAAYDRCMDREYTTLIFEQDSTDREVVVNEVQEPNSFGGWGYLVHVTDPRHGELGIVDDLEAARELAMDFMESHSE